MDRCCLFHFRAARAIPYCAEFVQFRAAKSAALPCVVGPTVVHVITGAAAVVMHMLVVVVVVAGAAEGRGRGILYQRLPHTLRTCTRRFQFLRRRRQGGTAAQGREIRATHSGPGTSSCCYPQTPPFPLSGACIDQMQDQTCV